MVRVPSTFFMAVPAGEIAALTPGPELFASLSLALGRDHQYIEPVHLMVALLDQNGSPIRPLLTMLDVDVMQLRSKLGETLDRLP